MVRRSATRRLQWRRICPLFGVPPHECNRVNTPLKPQGPNAGQIKFWNEAGPSFYFAHKDAIRAEREPLTRRLIERAAPVLGERALEVGCGFGDVTIELGHLVGPGAFALGVDLSSAMLASARQSASSKGLGNISFENVDAQTYPFEHLYFDLVISQFGLMFFADPIAAFSNVKSGLRPGGRIAFLSWQPASEVSASRFL